MVYNLDTNNMKKILLLVACAAMFGVSCSNKTVPVSGDKEIEAICSGPEYRTNDKYIRASATGLSGDMDFAKTKAWNSASTRLAESVNQLVKSVTSRYLKDYQVEENVEFVQKMEQMTITAAKEKLSGVRVICERTFQTPEGKYRVHIALELVGEGLLQNASKKAEEVIKSETKLRIDYDYEKYKKIFEEEMKKLEAQN